MTKEEEKRAVEVLITTALMNVLSEQSEMVKEVYKYKTKQDFNTLIRLLDKMLKGFKSTFTDDQIEMLENMTDVYHEQSDSIRNQIISNNEQD
jgi:hypothetical protein